MDSSREKILQSRARVRLIEGDPGVGKTWFGCQLAQYELDHPERGVQPHQKILFLTFARNAVARIRQVFARQELADETKVAALAERVRVDTFCGFFWWLVECYGRYVKGGTTKRLWLIGSEDIPGVAVPNGHEGFTFDRIEARALGLLRTTVVRRFISEVYPLVVVDEFQDVHDRLFEIIEALRSSSRLVLLRGPGQCIYRGLPGKAFDPSQIWQKCIMRLGAMPCGLKGLDLTRQRYSPEIAQFMKEWDQGIVHEARRWPVKLVAVTRRSANDIPKKLPPSVLYQLKRMSSYLLDHGRRHRRPVTLGVLANTNAAVADLYRTIAEGTSYEHGRVASLMFNDNLLLQYGRLVLSLLKGHWLAQDGDAATVEEIAVQLSTLFQEQNKRIDTRRTSWQGLADLLRTTAQGQRKPHDPLDWEQRLGSNLSTLNELLRCTDGHLANAGIIGCPGTPFTAPDRSLLETLKHEFVMSIRNQVNNQGKLPVDRATIAFENANQQKVVFEKLGIQKNIQVMTIHKSKGREFDGVIVVLEDSHRAIWRETSCALDDEIEDLYRVAISRARSAFALVAFEDAWEQAAKPVQRLLPAQLFHRSG